MMNAHLLQYSPHMLQMLCPCRTEDQNVIKKYKHETTDIGLQNIIHKGLEGGRCVGETEGHDEELEMTAMRPERGLGNVVRVHAHLVIPATKIDLGEETSTLQLVKEFINHRNRKLVLDGAVVKSAKVDAEVPTAILLVDEEHRGGERRSRLPDDPLLQHIIALSFNLVLEEMWVAVGPHSHW